VFDLFKKKKTLPELSGPITDDIQMATRLIHVQNKEFWGHGRTRAPYISIFHEDCILGYAIGIITGIFQVTKSPISYARGDETLEELAHSAAQLAVGLSAFACTDRHFVISQQLSKVMADPKHHHIKELEKWGGMDGMAFAREGKLSKGGFLFHFYHHNVTDDEKSVARWE
jgi:hypothetical protein